MQHWVYGTVYNNANTVEESIGSVYASNTNIAIVDAFSTDGTYEKLLALKQDYNLKIARVKCSRGKGRDVALRMCQPGSFAGYFDLDAIYNDNFQKVLDSEIDRTLVWQHHSQTGYFSTVETALKFGGYGNYYGAEALEFISRTGIASSLPVQIGKNASFITTGPGGRERRYSSRVGLPLRMARTSVDVIRSQGLFYKQFTPHYGRMKSPLYLAAKLRGINRVEPGKSNIQLFMEQFAEKLSDHRQLGISDDWVALPLPDPLFEDPELVDKIVKKRWGQYHKYKRVGPGIKWGNAVLRNRDFLLYSLNSNGLRNYISADPYKRIAYTDFQEL